MGKDLFKLFQGIDDSEEKELKVRENYVRAPFKYPGSKARLVKEINNHIPYRDAYIEVFGGSAAILLSRNKSLHEVYNDRYAGVVSFYRCIRDKEKADRLYNRLELTVHSREEFIWCKETWQHDTMDDVERAARWLYMQHYSFAGIGKFFGRTTTSVSRMSNLHEKFKDYEKLHLRFKHVQVENLDWRECLKDFDQKHAVFYLDPPYLNTAPQAYHEAMGQKDHAKMLDYVMEMKGFVAVSGYDNELYNSYKWDERIEFGTKSGGAIMPRGTSENNIFQGQMDTDSGVTEVLWIKK